MSRLPIQDILNKYAETNEKLANTTNTQELISLSKQQKKLQLQAALAGKIQHLEESIKENEILLKEIGEDGDPEMLALTQEDLTEKSNELKQVEENLLEYLAPSDERDDNDIIVEIRAGAGGDESALFAGDLLRMYTYLAQKLDFKLKVIDLSTNDLGGYKEVIVEIRGDGAYSWFKYEAGVHRVQRVPTTEKQGRIHTSTASVVVMPLIEDNSDFKLDPKEVEMIVTTSSGHGGQSVNTTYSAVRLKHIPTGIEAQSQDERNQQQNRQKATQVLTSRVFDFYEQQRLEKETQERREQVGKADRSEKIRTYNFPQDRLTDHRYNQSWNQLPAILDGKIFEILVEIKRLEAERVLATLNG